MTKKATYERRKKLVYDRIKASMPITTAQKLIWDLKNDGEDEYRQIKGHAGMAAVKLVADTISNFSLPFWPKLSYAGMARDDHVASAHDIQNGTLLVHGDMRSMSGVRDSFDIPIEVKGGRMLPPSLLFHNGTVHIIAQSTFDDMLERITAYRDVPHRKNMFQPAPDNHLDYPPHNKEWPRREVMNNDMFSRASVRKAEKKTAVQAAMRGYVIHQNNEFEQGKIRELGPTSKEAIGVSQDDYLDEAERVTRGRIGPGQEVTLGKECLLQNRGGGLYVISKGTKAEIIRDMDGTGRLFYACFLDGSHMKGMITIHHIEGIQNDRDREKGEYDETYSHAYMR